MVIREYGFLNANTRCRYVSKHVRELYHAQLHHAIEFQRMRQSYSLRTVDRNSKLLRGYL